MTTETTPTYRIATIADVAGDKIAFEAISQMRAIVAAAKIGAALELIEQYEEAGEPVVVFTAHVEPAKVIAARPGWALIDGSVDAATRSESIARFQAGELKGIVGTRAMAEGVTLTRASNMIFVDLFWSPGVNDQAEDRIHRIGQKNACLYRTLQSDHPIDALVANLIAEKQERIEATVDASTKLPQAQKPASPWAAVTALPVIPEAVVEAPAARTTVPAPAVVLDDAAPRTVDSLTDGELLALAADVLGVERSEPREARTAAEQWARASLMTLTGSCDGAVTKDGEGFNKADTNAGRYLGHYIAAGGLLDDAEWAGAIEICKTYPKQVGPCPVDGEINRETAHALRERASVFVKAKKIKPTVKITVEGGRLLIEAPYNAAATNAWRTIPSRRWDSARKLNTVSSADRAALDALLAAHYKGHVCADGETVRVLK